MVAFLKLETGQHFHGVKVPLTDFKLTLDKNKNPNYLLLYYIHQQNLFQTIILFG